MKTFSTYLALAAVLAVTCDAVPLETAMDFDDRGDLDSDIRLSQVDEKWNALPRIQREKSAEMSQIKAEADDEDQDESEDDEI